MYILQRKNPILNFVYGSKTETEKIQSLQSACKKQVHEGPLLFGSSERTLAPKEKKNSWQRPGQPKSLHALKTREET